ALFVGGVSDFSTLSLARLLLCLPVLLLPTFLMGGTLPVLVRYYTSSLQGIGRGAGNLYAVNTFGAVLGTLLTGFWLLPALGVSGTLWTAAAINVVIAVVAYLLGTQAAPSPTVEAASLPRWAITDRAVTVALVGFGVSGFGAMILEVVWTRALIQVFGNSTYAFSIMLATFLIGLALGSALAGQGIDRARYPFFIFASLQLGIGVWAALATPLIQWLPQVFLEAYQRFDASFAALQATQFMVCGLLMLPATMGLGAVFPVVSKIFSVRAGGTGTSVGIPYADNTLGTVLGSLLAGFVFLPRLGLELSVLVAVVLYVLTWAVSLSVSRELAVRPAWVVLMGFAGLLASAWIGVNRLDPQLMSAGVYMYPEYFLAAEKQQQDLSQIAGRNKLLYYREGYCASIAVLTPPGGGLALQTNGKTDASTGDLSTQLALGHLPMLLWPEAQEVLVVGLASGCTTGSTLLHPVQRVECVEIEPAMTVAAQFFAPWNHNCLEDPRYVPVLQDARNYVLMTRQQYDMITAEPSNPWIAGMNNLFTLDYYLQCRQRLRPGGIMCQWLPAYNFTAEELKAALGTFKRAFKFVTLWSFPRFRTDLFAVGSMEPVRLEPQTFATAMRSAMQEDLRAMGTPDLWRFAGTLVLDEDRVRRFCAGARLNTDDQPWLEFSTPKHLYQRGGEVAVLRELYAAGAGTRMYCPPEQARRVLADLGVRLSPAAEVNYAWLVPYHCDPGTPPGLQEDTAELELDVQETPGGSHATLHVAPLPRTTWPDSLRATWPESTAAWRTGQTGKKVWAVRELSDAGVAVRWEKRAGEGDMYQLSRLESLIGGE
ncbi:MAG: fused MFS/spermidine synthase, partial [candidate division WS1 bacterium]|nr:fused MFS/spermidine synthase [candidate division WS1 bacterium]